MLCVNIFKILTAQLLSYIQYISYHIIKLDSKSCLTCQHIVFLHFFLNLHDKNVFLQHLIQQVAPYEVAYVVYAGEMQQ